MELYGYNNAVKILNDICKTCYSNSELGAVGRSLNIEDVEKVLDRNVWKPEDYYETIGSKQYHTYNESEYMTYMSCRYYAYIWELEEYSCIDDARKTKGQGITRSQQNELYTATQGGSKKGYKQANSKIQPISTYWDKEFAESNFIEKEYYNVLLKKDNTTSNLPVHWLASRCVDFYGYAYAGFGVQYVSGDISYAWLFSSNTAYNSYYATAVRPIVSIPLDSIILGDMRGTKENPISIQKK